MQVIVAAHRIAWDQHRGTTSWDQDYALVVNGVEPEAVPPKPVSKLLTVSAARMTTVLLVGVQLLKPSDDFAETLPGGPRKRFGPGLSVWFGCGSATA